MPRRGFKLRADGKIRAEDHFCGAGGTTTGVLSVEGWMVVHAANHDPTSILTHSTNYPMVEHSCADIPTMNPAGCPEADVLFTSPECKARSYAVGKQKDDPSLFDPKGDKTAERSRATMDEVTRFAAELQYLYVVVENVPQLISWCEPSETGHWPRIVKGKEVKCNCGATYRRWLRDMENVGYRRHRALFLNSQVFPPTPQSRDRVYVVLALDGVPFPDLNHECLARCDEHGIVMAGQKPKAHLRQPEPVRKAWGELDDVWGRLDQQYFYACPECGQRAEPAITPAATAIEWWRDPGPKIGEREEHGLPPLKDGTVERVGRGIIRLPGRPMVVPLAYLSDPGGPRPRGVDEALRTLTSQQLEALVVAVGGNLSERAGQTRAWSTAEVLRTLTGTLDRGLIVAGRENAVPKGVDSAAMPTATTINSLYQLEFPDLAQIVQAGGPTGAGRNPRDVLRELPGDPRRQPRRARRHEQHQQHPAGRRQRGDGDRDDRGTPVRDRARR